MSQYRKGQSQQSAVKVLDNLIAACRAANLEVVPISMLEDAIKKMRKELR
jgi:hypothetical protein